VNGIQFDAIGDVHGCFHELLALVEKLGYRMTVRMVDGLPHIDSVPHVPTITCPTGRKLLFVGDLVDRGPHSDYVLALVMQLVALDAAVVVSGNHDNKHMRIIKGNNVQIHDEQARTMAQIDRHGPAVRQKVFQFLESLPLVYEDENVIAFHAAYERGARPSRLKALALYGETNGERDETGRPVRLDNWERRYTGSKVLVHGHVPVPNPTVRVLPSGGCIWNIDTGCAFGGHLTALRMYGDKMELVSVPALARYAESPDIGDDN
jgi:protein phosphatase